MLNKEELIEDLRILHKNIVSTYSDIFEYKMKRDLNFSHLIEAEYESNGLKKTNEQNTWNSQYLNRSAYTLLNKILFIRICEDKGFMLNEKDKTLGFDKRSKLGQKLSMTGLQKWSVLIKNYSLSELITFAFRDMNRSYRNINLYKEDKYDWLIPNKAEIDKKFTNIKSNKYYTHFESLLRQIIETLDTSRYDFGITSDNVLGDVYENFLDKDTRKELGQFYTPDFVIKNILDNTVENVDVLKDPYVKVLDPSCGSGHFLIKAYEVLRRKFTENLEQLQYKYHKEEYVLKIDGNEFSLNGVEYWTEKYLHYHILKHCIYGSDIDGFALQITTINLLLKDLDNFIIDELNIIECDSLVYWEEEYNYKGIEEQLKSSYSLFITLDNGKEVTYLEAEELLLVSKFWNQSFDYVIGNPPYIPITKMSIEKREYYRDNYLYSEGRINTFTLFFERVMKRSRYIGFIVPSRILLNTQYSKIRDYILTSSSVKKIYDLSEGIFKDATVDTVIFILDMNGKVEGNKVEIERFIGKSKETKIMNQSIFSKLDNSYINIYINNEELELILKIIEHSVKLGEISDIKDGIIQGAVGSELFLGNQVDDQPNTKRVLYGKNINKYSVQWSSEYIRYDKDYLTELETERTLGRGRGLRLRDPEIFERTKILTRQTADRIIAALDENNYYYMNTLHGTHVMNLQYDVYYVLGVLNSELVRFYYTKYNYEVGKVFAQVKIENLRNIPIPKLNIDLQKEIATKVKEIILIKGQINNFENNFNPLEVEGNLLETFVNHSEENESHLRVKERLKKEIDNILYDFLKLDNDELEVIHDKEYQELLLYNILGDVDSRKKILDNEVLKLKKQISSSELIDQLTRNNFSYSETSDAYDVDVEVLLGYKQSVTKSLSDLEKIKFCDLSPIYNFLFKKINELTLDSYKSEEAYFTSFDLEKLIQPKLHNLDQIMDLLRINNSTLSFISILEQGINNDSETIRTFLSKGNTGLKKFIKYDTTIYGLADWSDEIHKRYFIDAIDYYTSDSNEKFKGTKFEGIGKTKRRAETALKNLGQLDFKDKEEYLRILTDKVKKAFD